MLELIFLKVINMSWGAGIVILIVCLARFLLKRFPKYISYMLWSVVLFRLFCPMILEVDISPVRNIEPILYEYTVEEEIVLPETIVEYNDLHIAPETVTDSEDGQTAYEPIVLEENSKEEKRSWQEWAILVGQYVWILGMSVMFLRFAVSVMQMRKKVSTAIPVKDNIYITDEILSPFVMGILRPRIYLSTELSEKEQEYIILHEKFHIRRCDHIIKVIAYVALCIHWFNPLVWLSYVLFCKDMEMSCDEAVIKKMGEGIRADYSASLLALATRHQIIGIPVDFGEGDTKGRIKNLARFRKIKPAVIVVLVIGVVILIVFLAFNNKSSNSDVNGLNDEGDIAGNEEETNLYNEYQIKKSAINYYKIKDGVLYGRGRNTEGQLGLGKIEPLGVEYNYDVEIAKNVIHVDASNNGTVVYITENGELYGIGNNSSGQLGQSIEGKNRLSDEVNISTPVLIATEVRYALVGINFTMYLTEDDKLYVLGNNANGQLGNGEAKPVRGERYTSDTTPYSAEPVLVMENVRYIDCGLYNLAAITKRGDLYMWGDNSFGEMGNGRVGNKMPTASIDVVSEPYLVMKNIRKVTIEEFTVYAETMQGEVYTWGDSVAFPKKVEE